MVRPHQADGNPALFARTLSGDRERGLEAPERRPAVADAHGLDAGQIGHALEELFRE